MLRKVAGWLGRRYRPDVARLENYRIEFKPQRDVVEDFRAWLPRIGEYREDGRGAVWYGSVGTGKDFLMAVALYSAAWDHGIEGCFLSTVELFRALRDAMDRKSAESDVMRDYFRVPILALSDPIPESGDGGKWKRETLYDLIDTRYRQGRPTWVTANVADEAEFRRLVGAATADRLLDGAKVFRCFWPSYRQREGRP